MKFTEATLTKKIQVRYAAEAETSCCLSCGGALEKGDPQPGEVVVDLGSGRGNDVIKAGLQVGPEGKAYGIDFTEDMIHTARKNAEKLKAINSTFLLGEIDDIPLEDNIADLIVSNCTINHAKNKSLVYKEIYRILKPGGRFVVSDVIATEKLPPEVVADPEAWAGCYGGAIPKDEYFQSVSEGGFDNIEILEESEPYDKQGVMVQSLTIRSHK